ncbi:protein-tyrosine phosphatase [Sphingobium faniae]|nr:protein-tyrosine phosphatase [Sphingobium faniae]
MIFTCAPNFRDLGGLPVTSGGRVRPGLLYRSEAIATPPVDEAQALAALGIRFVCDLRSARERDLTAGHWPGSGATVLPMDVIADFRAAADPFAAMRADPGEAGATALMIATYDALPAACAPHLATLFNRLLEGDTPLLIHCTAGKDRTGFVVAMLLHALGVSDEAIMADYLRSGDCPNPAVTATTRQIMEAGLGGPVEERALDALTCARAAYLEASHARILHDHGSLAAYLRDAADLDDARRARLAAALVEQRRDI